MTEKNIVSGFTFIKHGLTLGYPILESILCIEPLCDEIIINVGYEDPELQKDDGTYEYLRDHLTHKKFKFFKTKWDPALTKQGLILSEQTNLALDKCEGKVCQYIQADEIIHEDDLPVIHDNTIEMLRDQTIEALAFNYIHFYGNVDTYMHTRRVYRREVRTIRAGIGLKSHLDAQGFRHSNGNKPLAKLIPARIFHYGWARGEQVMAKKIKAMDRLYHGDKREEDTAFKYERIWGLRKFKQTHPEIIKDWIKKNRNDIDVMALPLSFNFKDVNLAISDFIEELTGYRMGEYKSFRMIK